MWIGRNSWASLWLDPNQTQRRPFVFWQRSPPWCTNGSCSDPWGLNMPPFDREPIWIPHTRCHAAQLGDWSVPLQTYLCFPLCAHQQAASQRFIPSALQGGGSERAPSIQCVLTALLEPSTPPSPPFYLEMPPKWCHSGVGSFASEALQLSSSTIDARE